MKAGKAADPKTAVGVHDSAAAVEGHRLGHHLGHPAGPQALADTPVQVGSNSVSFFVSDRSAPRHRRVSDFVRLFFGFGLFALFGWVSARYPKTDQTVLDAVRAFPGWVRSLCRVGFGVASLIVFVTVLIAIVRAGRGRGLVRDLFCALGIAIVLGALANWVTGSPMPDLLPELISSKTSTSFPMLRVAQAMVVSLVLAPYLTVPVKRWLQWSTAIVVVTPLVWGIATLTSVSGAIVLSVASVASVRVIFGSPEGLPSIARLTETLADVGTHVTNLQYRADQPGTVGLATATSDTGEALHIKIYGVDAASRQRAERIWNSLWYRTAGPSPGAGRIQQAQHEALALMTARMVGVDVPEVRAAGRTVEGDVLLVTSDVKGTRLANLLESGTAGIDTGVLTSMWTTLMALHHDARIAHGRIDAATIRVHDDGVQLTNFVHSSLLPTLQQYATDIVSMLVLQALATDSDRAIDSAVENVGAADLTTCLPFVQDAVVAPQVRAALRHAHIKTDHLRAALAKRLGVDDPHPAPIRRVRTQDLVIAVFAFIAANSLISQIAHIGLKELSTQLAHASMVWLAVAFVVKLMSYVDGAYGLRVTIQQPLPMLPTTLLQSAKSFVGLAVPSVAGQNGLDLRFLQKQGVPMAVATTQGPLVGVIGTVAKFGLLVLSGWAIGQSVDSNDLKSSGGGTLITLAVVLIVVGLLAIVAVPKWRVKVMPALRQVIGSVKHMVSSPRTIGGVFATQAIGQLMMALALSATVAAFGVHLSFPAVVFASIGTSMLAGLSPVPNGIGVAEATMSGLLTTIGLPADQSFTIAITYRIVTAYLPPVLGVFSLRWLTKQGYL